MIITEQDKQMMREAIRLSAESVKNGGGPSEQLSPRMAK